MNIYQPTRSTSIVEWDGDLFSWLNCCIPRFSKRCPWSVFLALFLGFVKMNGTYVTAFESLGLDR